MGTSLYSRDLTVEGDYCGCENCTDILVRSRPDVVQEIHESFLEAGADIVETDSFGAAKHTLGEFDLQDECFTLSKAAAEIARAAADKFSTKDKPRFVAGSMGPGTKLITLDQISWARMLESYRESARGLIAGGADAIILETCQDLLQVKCATNAILRALEDEGKGPEDVPIFVSVTIEQTGTMLVGTSIEAAASALRHYPIASLGLNCATGPTEMGEYVHYLCKHWDRHVSVIPNAGLPVLVEGRTEYPLGPGPFVEAMARFISEHGVSMVGGCCGTTPEHIRQLADRVATLTRAERTIEPLPPASTSLYSPTEHRQDNSFLIVGERCNASGSRKFKRLLEEEDWDSIVSLAREQVRDGSHVLDINVDYAGRDNAKDMGEVVKRLVRQVDAPLMIDSTQVATIEAGLMHAAGKCVINSANFEDGEAKFDEICRLAKIYNAAIVIGSIDEDPEAAMARTAERKHAIARRAMDRAVSVHGLSPGDIFFDPLVLPISTGMDSDRRSALELIEGTRRIAKDMPEAQITCGLSNVSFGLKPAARVVLNSVFLAELVNAGMTSAIVHASKILPLNKIDEAHKQAALELIYDRRHESKGGTGLPEGVTDPDHDPLQHLIELFKDVEDAGDTRKAKADMSIEERLRAHIIDGEKDGLHEALDEAMGTYAALDIINDHLLDGMKTVGELFGSGQMQLPFVLQSAEVMKKAVAHLEPHLDRVEGETKGTIVLATVKGDVHDIGKNLVDIILSNNGYTVHNIGIKQPITAIVEAIQKYKPNAVGLSGLLVKSVNVMEENLRELNELGMDIPVILGGAALSRHYAEGYLRSVYKGQCLYGKDAFEGLRVMDMLAAGKLDTLGEEIQARLQKRSDAEEKIARSKAEKGRREEAFEQSKLEPAATGDGAVAVATAPVRSDVARDVPVPAAPFFGSRVVADIDLDQVFPFINPIALFRGQWQFKKGRLSEGEYKASLEDKVYPVFERWKARCKADRILEPKVVYGYYPVQSRGDELLVYDAQDHDKVIETFRFPRQDGKRRLCISDFFRSVDSGEKDVLGLHCVTVGPRATEVCRDLFAANDYTEYLYLHGLAVETAEALAEFWHKRIRQELGIAGDDAPRTKDLFTQKYRGSRYSFGYPACPDMSDQDILFRLLDPARIGCQLTENWQIDPEQSTSAIVVHHPEAKYFNV
ncbi:MAG: methionine synthase [Phycisphaerales bacterium]|nr:MAG: methionine synthase [Phycisphaerales bacterium]